METTLNLQPSTATNVASAPTLPRAITTKVQEVERSDQGATLPSNRPFVAQVVTARLSGSEYPENPTEIAPPDRTLRPYDVPMLPYDGDAASADETSSPGTPVTQITTDEASPQKV